MGSFMEKIAIQLKEKNGAARNKEPLSLGVPLPKGAIQSTEQLGLSEGQRPVCVQLEPLTHWPDGSIRWIHASFLATLGANSKKEFLLTHTQPQVPSLGPALDQVSTGLVIHTAVGHIKPEPDALAWQFVDNQSITTCSKVTLTDDAGMSCTARADTSWEVTHEGPIFIAINLRGGWQKQSGETLARFSCELRIFLDSGHIQVDLTTHNPKRAHHPGGLWDLGDPGSVYFQELAIETMLPKPAKVQVTPQATTNASECFELSDFNLYQDSSGGINWHSRNHVDYHGTISTQFCGYRLSKSRELLHEGKRANPLISIEYEYGRLDVAIPGFWQNFPTSIRKDEDQLTIGLFPRDAKNTYELQGGERKSLRCFIGYDADINLATTAYTPLIATLSAEYYDKADAFPWFTANSSPSALDELITTGLTGKHSFFAKRELIDEFGWRNFGDLFADHETLYQDKDELPFISHYNNQYDPIYGFARQFALTGDERWFQLMDDLARHVVDIDIYHTNEDRTEYNNGLFWHTDHYLDAHTATHRTFSKHNHTSSTPGQTGGGPADEHCYSTGLLYHYYLTGSESSREAVLALARWITSLYEGQDGLFAQMLRLKKREIPIFRKMIKGEHATTHKYPFTRGTGNYLNTILDAWLLDGDRAWLEQAEAIIKNTIHPEDDIEHRNLLNIETRWSYLILLSSLFRYLWLKRQMDVEDKVYQYTRASVLRYAQWMLLHERPFLVSKAGLEFANDTWVAQDIRKAMILFQASELAPNNAPRYQETGKQWLDDVTKTLLTSPEAHFTRIIVILMQNYGPQSILSTELYSPSNPDRVDNLRSPPVMTWRLLTLRIGTRMLKGLLSFRPMRELRWLLARLDRS